MATRRSWTASVSGDERTFSSSLMTRSIQKDRPRCSVCGPEGRGVTVAMCSLGNPPGCLRCAETPAERCSRVALGCRGVHPRAVEKKSETCELERLFPVPGSTRSLERQSFVLKSQEITSHYEMTGRLERGPRACYFGIDIPEWRNWQTRWTQNPVVLSTVWVRPPPPGPFSYVFIESSVTIAMDRKKGPRFGDLGLGGQYKIANHIYH